MAREHALDNPTVVESILKLIRSGIPLDLACESNGVNPVTLRSRMKRDDDLSSAVAQARADGQIAMVRTVQGGDGPGMGFGPAKASLELLQRINPKQFAQRVNIKVEEELSEFLDLAERVLPADWYEKLLMAYSALQSGDGICSGQDTSGEGSEGTP
jgi:hypothetical protein